MKAPEYDRAAAVDTLRNSLRQLYGIDRAISAFITAERHQVVKSGISTPPEVREVLRELERLSDKTAPHRIGLDFILRHLNDVASPLPAEEESGE
ncbi:hypothetical protein [Rhizobium sp. RAF56]|uniref:hypothetical protein n=1 Tax=Rhizobium sp. RAF56 TaxID=3233062 RepID=UPI003F97B90B